ncbi:MAG: 2-C-methyl-D-erythritol 4-phosphate cytidylyltransferase [Clostridia bacterium]|nr:2-C-methyl-D-erythritol 4-phosphate cytidylyltransferase [Clostridia bacterium]
MDNKNIGIVLAGGIGSRFGGSQPKQYYQINGKEMIYYSIKAFEGSKTVDDFIVVVDRAEYESGRIADKYKVRTVVGGDTRNRSLKNALDHIKENYPRCEKIIENNAACPMITSKVIDSMITILDDYDYIQCTYKITDALGSYKTKYVDRDDYFLIQSPDAYKFDLLYKYFDADSTNGHPAAHLPESAKGYNYFDFQPNIKVTYPEDLRIIEIVMNGIDNSQQ